MPSLSEMGEHPNDAVTAIAPQSGSVHGRLLAGDLLADRFLVVRYVAGGGMGEVYEVEDRQLQGVRLALKTILPHIAANPEMRLRFEREVLLARRVSHPSLCPIYDMRTTHHNGSELMFLTMKLLAGETLATRLKRSGAMSVADTAPIVAQVGAALTAAHDAGVLHRDIKTANIMLQGQGENVHAVVMDFGLARTAISEDSATALTVEGVAGTLGYLAPELLHGAPASKASDVFAFGVVVYKMLTGQVPTAALDLKAKLARDPALAKLPADWQRLLLGCLETSPAKRFQDMPEALASLQGVRRKLSAPATLSRRQMLALAGGTAAAAAAGTWLEWPRIENYMHPLPAKRFVAVVNWPATEDAKASAVTASVAEAIAGELPRAEAYDHSLWIVPSHIEPETRSIPQLNEIRESLGANLVFAISTKVEQKVRVLLQVMDTATSTVFRERWIAIAKDQQLLLPEIAVHAATELLGIKSFRPDNESSNVGTANQQAFDALKDAQAAMGKANDGGVDTAIEKYKQAIDLDGRYAEAYAGLAKAYCRLSVVRHDAGFLGLAKANSDKAILLDARSVSGHMARASTLQQIGDNPAALEEIKKALAVDPSNYQTLVWQAGIYTELNRWQDAEAALRRGITARPNQWLAHQQLGFALNAQGKYAESLKEFQIASRAAPQSTLPYSNMAAVLLQLGKVDEALENCQKSLQLEPNALAAETMATILRIRNNYANAAEYAKKAAQLDPGDTTNWLELGDCLSLIAGRKTEAAHAYAEAEKIQISALEMNPVDGPGVILLALYQAKLNASDTAHASLERAEKLPCDDLDSQMYRARALEVLGDRKQAVDVIRRCLSRGATRFQFETMPDMRTLTQGADYESMIAKKS